MKRSILLLTAGLIAGISNGQEATRSFLFKTGVQDNNNYLYAATPSASKAGGFHSGERTTSVWPGPGGGRWYDYSGETLVAGGIMATAEELPNLTYTGLGIWQDTTSLWGGATYSGNPWTSYGLSFCPTYGQWNGAFFPATDIAVSLMDSFKIDSVMIGGWYGRNITTAAKRAVVDTLILTFVQSPVPATTNMPQESYTEPSLLSFYGVAAGGSVDFYDMLHDSLNNRAGDLLDTVVEAVPSTQVFKFLLFAADTNAGTGIPFQFPRTSSTAHSATDVATWGSGFQVHAGYLSSMSVSFKSGDATYPTTFMPGTGFKDTVEYATSTAITGYKYGCFTAIIDYAGTTTAPAFPQYHFPAGDYTTGFFKEEGGRDLYSANQYSPNWGWTTGGGTAASALQYPEIIYHINCPTCNLDGDAALGVANVINPESVNIYPNPATNVLNVNFSTKASSVDVSLVNMVGQTVASQSVNNGTAVFNTTTLADGIYILTLNANGERNTSRVVIAH